jgi:hypothetical protein
MVRAWHGMESVNQTQSHSINQIRKTHSKPIAARHGRGNAWARHGHGMLCVNRPLGIHGIYIYICVCVCVCVCTYVRIHKVGEK